MDDPAKIPNGLKEAISRDLKESKSPLDLWQLSGPGWKSLVSSKVDNLCDGLAGGLNTPDYPRVAELLKKVFGVKTLKSNWSWKGMSSDLAVGKLDELVKIRGAL